MHALHARNVMSSNQGIADFVVWLEDPIINHLLDGQVKFFVGNALRKFKLQTDVQ